MVRLAGILTKASDIVVFTGWAQSVHCVPADARLVMLDDAQQLEALLSLGLPVDAAKSRWDCPANASHWVVPRCSYAWRMLIRVWLTPDAWRLGIRSVPAVVADQRYVVYGEANVARAGTDSAVDSPSVTSP